jgi:hypothetical protein
MPILISAGTSVPDRVKYQTPHSRSRSTMPKPRSRSTVPTQVTVNRSHPGHGPPFPPRLRSSFPAQVTVNRSHPGHGQPFPPRSRRSTGPIRGQSQPAQFPATVNLPIQDQGHPAHHRSWSPQPITGSSPLLHGTVNVLIPDPVSGSFVGNA